MHTGLNHFAGRGLPTIWSVIVASHVEERNAPVFPFTEKDAEVIEKWAKNLDDWLVSSNRKNDASGLSSIMLIMLTMSGPSNTAYDGVQIRRQYTLHRLFVLSIYHPARGFDLFANSVASSERRELLLSARATLTLQNNDKGIWANWDLVVRCNQLL
jgi:hypothetical protein